MVTLLSSFMKVDSSVITASPEAILPAVPVPVFAPGSGEADEARLEADLAIAPAVATTDAPAASATSAASSWSAVLWGSVGVLAFSMTLPATRVAVGEIDAVIVGPGRAVVAGVLAAIVLLVTRQRLPPRALWGRLVAVAIGVVIAFGVLTALALKRVPASHAAVMTGLLPAMTAVMAALRTGERPSRGFWISCALGLAAVLVFAIARGAGQLHGADLFILLALLLCSWGYAEGAAAARVMGGWQVMCWGLVAAWPFVAPIVIVRVATHGVSAGPAALAGFAYVSLVSSFLGMFAWYRGLAQGGIARIGQLQLAQPVLTLIWAALLLGERVTMGTIAASVAVLASVALTQRMRVARAGINTR
jgi:drug/metabolite transporter (DMT)-like permease